MKVHDDNFVGVPDELFDVLNDFVEGIHADKVVDNPVFLRRESVDRNSASAETFKKGHLENRYIHSKAAIKKGYLRSKYLTP